MKVTQNNISDNMVSKIEDFILSKVEGETNLLPTMTYKEVQTKKTKPKYTATADYYLCTINSIKELEEAGIKLVSIGDIDVQAILFCKDNCIYMNQIPYMTLTDSRKNFPLDLEVLVVNIEDIKDKTKKILNLKLPKKEISSFKLYCPSKTIESTFTESKQFNLSEINTTCYCVNLHKDYFSQNLQKWMEIYYSYKDEVWKSSFKTVSELQALIKDISKNGFKYPLCFCLTSQGQLISLGCNTRLMIAKYLGMEYIPAIICNFPQTEEKYTETYVNKLEDQRALAEYYLSPYIVYTI